MRTVQQVRLENFPYASVLVISPHPDDSVLGCGGLVFKLASHRQARSRVKITVFSLTPGYHGVDAGFFRECEAIGRENLVRWPGVPKTELEDDVRLIAALRERLGEDFDLFGEPGESDQKKLENIIRTAIRFGESSREVETLGLSPSSALRFLALPRLYAKCICPGELVRLRQELSQAADQGAGNLLLGFGGRRPNAFGKYCEVFQMRLRSFYACQPSPNDLLFCSDDPPPMDAEAP